ncbi:MAG: carboxymuconolactone decarboxylase family protein [Oligoflexia bacterium]|nr:carboxymuconolactone decarboxylase family protein [Oligoflexia bacterium]
METQLFTETLEKAVAGGNTPVARDLRLNLRKILEDGALGREEGLLALLALSRAVEDRTLEGVAREELAALGVGLDLIQEAADSAAIMGMLNVYYRFRHMIGPNDPDAQDYRSAGLRMTSLARPLLGKERFELLSFAVSVINGCESCIRSHERVLRDAGVEVEKIHDLARLAATVKGISVLR